MLAHFQDYNDVAGDHPHLVADLANHPVWSLARPEWEVKFDMDANGILNVSAKDLGTGKEQSIRITASSGLSEEEIEKMVTDAEEHSHGDFDHHVIFDCWMAFFLFQTNTTQCHVVI